jgi:hypothetical protein
MMPLAALKKVCEFKRHSTKEPCADTTRSKMLLSGAPNGSQNRIAHNMSYWMMQFLTKDKSNFTMHCVMMAPDIAPSSQAPTSGVKENAEWN